MENKMKGLLYNQTVFAKSLTDLKRKMSIIANQYYNPFDEAFVTIQGKEFKFIRINQKCPNNTIIFGKWK